MLIKLNLLTFLIKCYLIGIFAIFLYFPFFIDLINKKIMWIFNNNMVDKCRKLFYYLSNKKEL